MQLSNIIAFSIALIATSINALCNPTCVSTIQGQLQSQCGSGTNTNSNICLCNNYSQLMQCFNGCNDAQSQNELMNYQAQARNVCNTALQGASLPVNNNFIGMNGQATQIPNGPTPTINGLFAASTIGTDLHISAGNTDVIVPFSGSPQNTNVPVVGSLYSSYSLGSITVGYKSSAAPTFTFRSASNSNTIDGKTVSIICISTTVLSILSYLL
ncbi:hypothetical protein K502DRAFT_348639 [Neoconidiobolus thromboides FSU 785]|nr:hypothetical protein K502DRAFT_332643 [Neoconidiobolus thromboides FSU 785]KAI9295864.1 hypothetical protein K502DRAFT_348639 [Neoconidiobolus thromboides FSU 785]